MVNLTSKQALSQARSNARKGNSQKAQSLYEAVLKEFPTNSEAREGLSELLQLKQTKHEKSPSKENLDKLVDLFSQGKFEKTIEAAQHLSLKYPRAAQIWNIIALANKQIGNVNAAAQAFEKVLELHPEVPDSHNNFGVALKSQGKFEKAIETFNKALSIKPNFADALYNKGTVLQDQGNLEKALEAYEQALQFKPDYFQALYNIGNIKQLLGKPSDAIKAYRLAIALKPDFADAYYNMAAAFRETGQLDEAEQAYKTTISFRPNFSEAFNNIGVVLQSQGKLEDSIQAFGEAIRLKPDNVASHNNMGNALQDQGKLDEAIESYNIAISLKPNYAQALNNKANALRRKRMLAEALTTLERSLELKSDSAEGYNNLGAVFQDQDDFDKAVENYKTAVTLQPDFSEAYCNMGYALKNQGKIDESIQAFHKALEINPNYQKARAHKLNQLALICNWEMIENDRHLIADLGVKTQIVEPLSLMALEDSPKRHRQRSEIYVNQKCPQAALGFPSRPSDPPKRLRIGYFSADFKEHPVTYLISKVLESHDREAFKIFGYSIHGKQRNEFRQRLEKSFDCFDDIMNLSDQEAAHRVRKDKIDIAVDLNGYTKNARPGIFAYRVAPLQINYLGYPGSMGASFIDYIVADQTLIPLEYQKYYSEKPIYLPNHYQAQVDLLPFLEETPTRRELGLPETGFVFCAINSNYKLGSCEFTIWMRLLKEVKGSVLWLLEGNIWVKNNLRREASKRGINPDRLVFAKNTSFNRYLSQFKKADLYLDTFIYNAGATASHALWAGLPIITKIGKSYASRMAGSLLSSLNLSELITTNASEYERLALNIALQPEKVVSLKQKLKAKRNSSNFFNIPLFTQHLENGFLQAYHNYLDGNPTRPIFVPK